MSKNIIFMICEVYDNKQPCIWEKGGALSPDILSIENFKNIKPDDKFDIPSTGYSIIVCDRDGKEKQPVITVEGYNKIREENKHALIPVEPSDYLVNVFRNSNIFIIRLFEIISFDLKLKHVGVLQKYCYSVKSWDVTVPFKFKRAIEKAREKSLKYFCDKPFFIKE